MRIFLVLFVWFVCGSSKEFHHALRRVSNRDELVPHYDNCQKITVPFCMNVQYNTTVMPNILNHQNQEEAGLEVHQFLPLVNINCSSDLQFFLCSVYVPVCTILEHVILPCRSLCFSAKNGCESVMESYGFKWPEFLDCAQYPEGQNIDGDLCVGENKITTSTTPSSFGEYHWSVA